MANKKSERKRRSMCIRPRYKNSLFKGQRIWMTLLLSFCRMLHMHLCVKYRQRESISLSLFTPLFQNACCFFGYPFYASRFSFFFFHISPGKWQTLFSHIWNQMILDFWTWSIEKHFVWSKMLIKLSTLYGKTREPFYVYVLQCVSLCMRSRTLSFFCQEFGQVEPFSTQIKRGCQKTAKNIKWNNTWKFNSTETFDRNKQRNCTWIEQSGALPVVFFFGFSLHKPLVADTHTHIYYLFGCKSFNIMKP